MVALEPRIDPFAQSTPTPDPAGEVPVIVANDRPLSRMAMAALQIYAFGGLAFVCSVVAAAVGYWFWIVVVKRQYADSPPELELNPRCDSNLILCEEQKYTAASQDALVLHKIQQAEMLSVPPSYFPGQPPSNAFSKPSRSPEASATPRKSSLCTSPSSKGRRVSWANTSTIFDPNDNSVGVMTMFDTLSPVSSTNGVSAPSHDFAIPPLPPLKTDISHGRAPPNTEGYLGRRTQMIVPFTPSDDITSELPKDAHHYPTPRCTCFDSVDPLKQPPDCMVHARYN